MTLATEAIGVSPIAALGLAAPPSVPVPASLPGAGLVDDCYTLELDAYSGGASVAWVPDTIGTFPIGTLSTPYQAASLASIALSDRGYTTGPAESPANVHFEARLRAPLLLARTVPLTPESGARAPETYGLIEIDNADGLQDGTADLAIDGRAATIKRGLRTDPYSSFVRLFRGAGVKWERTTNALRLALRGRDYLLETPLQPNLYAGTGGAEGGAELKGKPKPLVFGIVRDFGAVAVDTAKLIYQLHDGPVFAIDAVYDRAQALTFDADYAAYAALAAATIPAGRYATCVAAGHIRLGGTPVGLVTADLRGDAAPEWGGYTANAANIARRILLARAGLGSADLDETGIEATAFRISGVVGYDFVEPVTVAEALDRVCAGAFLWWGNLRGGAFTVRRMAAPGSPRYQIGVSDIVGDVELQGLPASVDPCNWRRRVGYARCRTPQSGTEIDNAALLPARRDFVREAFRVTTVAAASRTSTNLTATDPPPVESAFDQENDAAGLAQNLLDLFAPGRKLYRVPIRLNGHDIDLDDTVRVTWPRHGLAAGKDLRVIGMDEDHAARRVTLLLFG